MLTGWRRLSHDKRILLLAILVGLPGVAASLGLLWLGANPAQLQWKWTPARMTTERSFDPNPSSPRDGPSTLNGKPLGKTRIPILDKDRLAFGGFEVVVNVLAPGEFPDMELGGQTKRMRLPKKRP